MTDAGTFGTEIEYWFPSGREYGKPWTSMWRFPKLVEAGVRTG
jgi:hypothetical protein